nr:phage minor tail protein L [uncultured Mediterranean phage uvMED]
MTRSLTTAVKNALATNDIRPVHLITIGFTSPVNITDCSFALTSSVSGSSVTYSSSSFIMGISNFTEETDVTKTSLTLSLSGADQTFISTVLNESVVNDSVDIFRGLLNSSNALVADPFLLYSGTIDSFTISESKNSSNVNLQIVSHWADFDKTNGRKTNNTSQQRFFSADVGMDFSSETVQDIKWGRP